MTEMYQLVIGSSMEVQREVNELMNNGRICQGSVSTFVSLNNEEIRFVQAMIKGTD